jgi:hypothetical protein
VSKHDIDLLQLGAGVGVRMAYADQLRRRAILAAMHGGEMASDSERKQGEHPKVKMQAPMNRAERRREEKRLRARRKR